MGVCSAALSSSGWVPFSPQPLKGRGDSPGCRPGYVDVPFFCGRDVAGAPPVRPGFGGLMAHETG